MADVAAIMAQLEEAKQKKKNAANYAVRTGTKPRAPRKSRSVKLGKRVGYCPTCGIYLGESEVHSESDIDAVLNECQVEKVCSRCGDTLESYDKDRPTRKKQWMDSHQPWGDQTIPATFKHSANAVRLDGLDLAILRHGNRSIL